MHGGSIDCRIVPGSCPNPVVPVGVCYIAVDAAAGGLTTGLWTVVLECFSSHPLGSSNRYSLFSSVMRWSIMVTYMISTVDGKGRWQFSLHKILFYFIAFLWESMILLLLPSQLQTLPYCNTIATPLRNIRPPPPTLLIMTYTIQYW